MKNENNLKEQFQKVLDLFKDKNYIEEEYPARMFVEHAQEYLGLDIESIKKNQSDPPDFFLTVSNKEVNLEVTNLADEFTFGENAKFDLIESVGREIVEKHKHLLPAGGYMIMYYPGDKQIEIGGVLTIPVPDFSSPIKKSEKAELEKQMDEGIFNLFSTFKQTGSYELPITNRKKQIVGKVSIIRLVTKGGEVNCMWAPQAIGRFSSSWKPDTLKESIQSRVNKKEELYSRKTSKMRQLPGQCWLLISDIHDNMGTSHLSFNISSLSIETSFFERVFLIHDINNGYKIDEIEVSKKQ